MELTKQVPNLQLCKKLKELGWDKETYFVWSPIPKVVGKNGICETVGYDLAINGKQRTYGSKVCYPAPTVAELGEALPKWAEHDNFFATTEADARAKMWIYLKEKNLL